MGIDMSATATAMTTTKKLPAVSSVALAALVVLACVDGGGGKGENEHTT